MSVTVFKRKPRGRLIFTKRVLPSVNKSIIISRSIVIILILMIKYYINTTL